MDNLFRDYTVDVDVNEIYRVMGYPGASQVSSRAKDLVRRHLDRAHEYVEAWGTTRTISIREARPDQVILEDGQILESERVARILQCADSLAVGMVTAGHSVRVETRRLMAEGSQADALAVDAVGTVVTERLMGRLDKYIEDRARKTEHGTTIYYAPGYTGWKLTDQEILFSYFSEADVPVRLNEHMMMHPAKSLMGIIGLTPGGKHAPEVVPCQLCDLQDCSMRRVAYRGKTEARKSNATLLGRNS